MELLRAASYGKNFQPDADTAPSAAAGGGGGAQSLTHAFVGACKKLRILNALRNFEIGMPLTAGAPRGWCGHSSLPASP